MLPAGNPRINRLGEKAMPFRAQLSTFDSSFKSAGSTLLNELSNVPAARGQEGVVRFDKVRFMHILVLWCGERVAPARNLLHLHAQYEITVRMTVSVWDRADPASGPNSHRY